MNREEMYERTMQFSTRVVRMLRSMLRGIAEDVLARQLVRSATSIGANYREACHGRSTADFIAKVKICEAEADETLCRPQQLVNSDIMNAGRMQSLIDESREFVATFTSATKSLSYKSQVSEANGI